jgi:hypothetical protein
MVSLSFDSGARPTRSQGIVSAVGPEHRMRQAVDRSVLSFALCAVP